MVDIRLSEREYFTEDDLEQTQVREDGWVPVAVKKADNTELLALGFGTESRDGRFGVAEADLVASGNGAGTAGDEIEGELRGRIYFSDKYDDAKSKHLNETLRQLRQSVSSSRDNKVLMPWDIPTPMYAKRDQVIVYEVKAAEGYGGYEVDSGNSVAELPYSRIPISKLR